MNLQKLEKHFEKKVLNINSLVERHEVKSYTAYRIKKGLTFVRLYPDKITLGLPFKYIQEENFIKKYNLQDNSDRSPRHELQTKGSPFSQKYLDPDFLKLVKRVFNNKSR